MATLPSERHFTEDGPAPVDIPADPPPAEELNQAAVITEADEKRTAEEAQAAKEQAAQELAAQELAAKQQADKEKADEELAPKAPNASGYEGDTLTAPATEQAAIEEPAAPVLTEAVPPEVAPPVLVQTPALQKVIDNRYAIDIGSKNKEAIKEAQQTLVKADVATVVDGDKYKEIKPDADGIRRVDGKIAFNKEDLGNFGKQTQAAVKQFQEAAGLNKDGVIGIATAGAFKAIDASEVKADGNYTDIAKKGAMDAVMADGKLTDREKKALGSIEIPETYVAPVQSNKSEQTVQR